MIKIFAYNLTDVDELEEKINKYLKEGYKFLQSLAIKEEFPTGNYNTKLIVFLEGKTVIED